MPQFFKFINRKTKAVNKVNVIGSYNKNYAKNIHLPGNDKTNRSIFIRVAIDNNWDIYDIIAVGDYGNLVWVDNFGLKDCSADQFIAYGYIVDEPNEEYKTLYYSVWEDLW